MLFLPILLKIKVGSLRISSTKTFCVKISFSFSFCFCKITRKFNSFLSFSVQFKTEDYSFSFVFCLSLTVTYIRTWFISRFFHSGCPKITIFVQFSLDFISECSVCCVDFVYIVCVPFFIKLNIFLFVNVLHYLMPLNSNEIWFDLNLVPYFMYSMLKVVHFI